MNTDILHSKIKDAFHEMVAGIQKQPKTGLSPAQKRAKRIASEASMQSAGQGSGVRTKEGSRKKSNIAREVAKAAATTSGDINMIASLDIRARHGITNIVAT